MESGVLCRGRCRRPVTIGAALLALLVTAPARADAAWRQIRTGNFLLIGDVADRDLQTVAVRLERFRDAVGRLMPGAVTSAPVPIVVILFRSDRAFEPYRGVHEGHGGGSVTGYFQAADTISYIAMNLAQRDDALRVVFHEYVHSVIGNTIGRVPDWFGEGLAQVYETLQEDAEGRAVFVGAALLQHLVLMLQGPLMPLDQLLDAETLSFSGGTRRSLFYAQSWALVHFLALGSEVRARQLRGYIERLQRGQPFAAAFTAAFGSDTRGLEQEYRAYIQQLRFRGRRVVFDERLATVDVPAAEPLAAREGEAFLGDLLARIGNTAAARRHLTALLDGDATNGRAAAALGWLEMREQHVDAAVRLLERAAGLLPDDGQIQGELGAALYEQARVNEHNRHAAGATLDRARAVLTRAVELDPRNAPALAALARVEGGRDRHPARAVDLMEAAIARAPARTEYRLYLAEALMRAGEMDRAKKELDALAERAGDSEVSDAARALAARLAGGPAAPSGGSAGRLQPALRAVQAGETRVSGRLTQMDCTGAFTVYRVQTADAVLRLAETLGGVQLLSYGAGSRRTIACGPVPDAPAVLATYRPTPGDPAGDGVAVAIEFAIADP
jgi:Tfp pilus assembly protein PilF